MPAARNVKGPMTNMVPVHSAFRNSLKHGKQLMVEIHRRSFSLR